MRQTLLAIPLLALLGCDQGYNFDRSISETQDEIATRVRPLDVSKPPPDVPLPKDSPRQIDVQLVATESAKITSLGIEDVVVGSGPILEPGKYATLHYVGMLPDGYVFDTTYPLTPQDSGEPYTLLYDPAEPRVIQGWIDGLKGMRVGGHRRLVIPASLAYGDTPPPGSPIPANAALKFEIVLMFVGDTE